MMVSKLPLDEIKGLRSIFRSIDVSNTGRVTLKQFADAIKQMGTKLPEADLRAMWKVRGSCRSRIAKTPPDLEAALLSAVSVVTSTQPP